MRVTINDNELNVEVLGDKDAPVMIAHHGGGGIGSLAEPKATFGPLATSIASSFSTHVAVVRAKARSRSRTLSGQRTSTDCVSGPASMRSSSRAVPTVALLPSSTPSPTQSTRVQ